MDSIVISLLLCQYVSEPHRFDQAVAVLALELYSKAPQVKDMCDLLVCGDTATKRATLASLEEHYSW